MSNKPKIYGTCAAGCLWETVHKEDFEKCAAVIPIYPNTEGKYLLEVGKKYRIVSGYSGAVNDRYRDFSVTVSVSNSAVESSTKSAQIKIKIDETNYAQYNDGVVFEVLDCNSERVIFDADGTRTKRIISNSAFTYDTVSITVENAMAVFYYNEDATITAKSAYEVAVDNGFDGTEAEWLASIGSIKLAQGFGYSAGAVMSQLAVTEAFEAIGSGELFATPTEGLAYELSADGKYYICRGIGSATDTDIVIASHINDIPVTAIGVGAFMNCGVKIESVYIPHTVTEIWDDAFRHCYYLKEVVISNGVTTIGELAFQMCTRLEVVNFGARVESIGRYAFAFCLSLKEIKLPDSLTRIEEKAFEDAFALKSAFIPASVTYIGAKAFGAHDVDPDDPQPEDEFAGCPNLSIYCEAKEKPSGWDETWNSENRPVAWGYITDAEKIVRETANAIKATASGVKVTLDDISPLTHTLKVQLKSNTITDFSGLTLKRYGATDSEFLETYTANADGTVYGVTSIYPTMTLEAPDAVTVEVEYNRDLQGALDGKLDKVTETYWCPRAYAVDTDGTQKMVEYSTAPNSYSLAWRASKGTLAVGTPTEEHHAVQLGFADERYAPKVANTFGINMAYISKPDGTFGLMGIGYGAPTEYTLVARTGGGAIVTGEPKADNHATTKKYVDDAIANAGGGFTIIDFETDAINVYRLQPNKKYVVGCSDSATLINGYLFLENYYDEVYVDESLANYVTAVSLGNDYDSDGYYIGVKLEMRFDTPGDLAFEIVEPPCLYGFVKLYIKAII